MKPAVLSPLLLVAISIGRSKAHFTVRTDKAISSYYNSVDDETAEGFRSIPVEVFHHPIEEGKDYTILKSPLDYNFHRKRGVVEVTESYLERLKADLDSPLNDLAKSHDRNPLLQIVELDETAEPHIDAYPSKNPQDRQVVDDALVAFVMMNDNPDAYFEHGDTKVPVLKDTMVKFPGNVPHRTVIGSGIVRLLGPFDVMGLQGVGLAAEIEGSPQNTRELLDLQTGIDMSILDECCSCNLVPLSPILVEESGGNSWEPTRDIVGIGGDFQVLDGVALLDGNAGGSSSGTSAQQECCECPSKMLFTEGCLSSTLMGEEFCKGTARDVHTLAGTHPNPYAQQMPAESDLGTNMFLLSGTQLAHFALASRLETVIKSLQEEVISLRVAKKIIAELAVPQALLGGAWDPNEMILGLNSAQEAIAGLRDIRNAIGHDLFPRRLEDLPVGETTTNEGNDSGVGGGGDNGDSGRGGHRNLRRVEE